MYQIFYCAMFYLKIWFIEIQHNSGMWIFEMYFCLKEITFFLWHLSLTFFNSYLLHSIFKSLSTLLQVVASIMLELWKPTNVNFTAMKFSTHIAAIAMIRSTFKFIKKCLIPNVQVKKLQNFWERTYFKPKVRRKIRHTDQLNNRNKLWVLENLIKNTDSKLLFI